MNVVKPSIAMLDQFACNQELPHMLRQSTHSGESGAIGVIAIAQQQTARGGLGGLIHQGFRLRA